MTKSNAWEPPSWMEAFDGLASDALKDRDYLFTLDLDFNPESQLVAIHRLLHRNKEADQELEGEIRQSEERAKKVQDIFNDYEVDYGVDLMHSSVYQGATHSLAAVGMIAPFLETVFSQCFSAIGNQFFGSRPMPNRHSRWKGSPTRIWDCRYYTSRSGQFQEGRVEGIMQLADASGLRTLLPSDIKVTLTALFEYRNKMFHHGLEWPTAVRQKFQARIVAAAWPADWFSSATTDGMPWMFYMSQGFIDHCINTADKILEAFSRLIETKFLSIYHDKARLPPESSP